MEHSFIREMADGTLDEATFRYFIVQDVLYLKEFEKSLNILLKRSSEYPLIHSFASRTLLALEKELELHFSLLEDWALSAADVAATPKNPTCTMYGSYLLATVYDTPAPEAFAVFLPCFWSFLDIGKTLSAKGSKHPMYQRWINTYCSAALSSDLDDVMRLVDQVGLLASEDEKKRIRGHFYKVSQFEWMFWDAAYRKESWPVS
jgi:thiaminase (transcriptional activator TenA)